MLAIWIGFVILTLDQATKFWIRTAFYHGESWTVVPAFFSLTYVQNTGAAWGIFGGLNGWLAVLSFVLLVLLAIFRRTWLSDSIAHRIVLGGLIGGILGNLADRARLGYVVDFLDFYCRSWHFPAFNVSDAAICISVSLYLLTTTAPSRPASSSAPGEHASV